MNLVLRVGYNGNFLDILGVYRSPNTSAENDVSLSRSVENFFSGRGRRVLVGDLNFPGVNWVHFHTKNARAQPFLSVCKRLGLTQLVTLPTRARGTNRPSLLDVILTKNQELINSWQQLPPIGNSDHSTFLVDFTLEAPPESEVKILQWNKAKVSEIHAQLLSIDWHSKLTELGIDEFWNFFHSFVLNKVMPLASYTCIC